MIKGEGTPFDHRPDPALGAALREALTAGDDAAFVERVMVRAVHPGHAHWDVLASWARAGIAAAAVAALVAGMLVGRGLAAPAPAPSLEEVLAATAGPSARELAVETRPPDASMVLAAAEER